MAAREAENHPCVDAFRTWLERLGTGCRFASHLASNALIHYELVTDPLTAEWVKVLDAHFDQAASEKKVVVTILPSLAWPSEIAEALVVLASMGRWSCTRVPSKRDEAAGNGLSILFTKQELLGVLRDFFRSARSRDRHHLNLSNA